MKSKVLELFRKHRWLPGANYCSCIGADMKNRDHQPFSDNTFEAWLREHMTPILERELERE